MMRESISPLHGMALLSAPSILLLLLTACALGDSSLHACAADAVAATEEARQGAARAGYEWHDTTDLIKQTRKLASEGKAEQAVARAKQAELLDHVVAA